MLEVVDLGRVVVVVAGELVVVVVSTTSKSAPFRMPKGSLEPDAGLPALVGAAQVGHSTLVGFAPSM